MEKDVGIPTVGVRRPPTRGTSGQQITVLTNHFRTVSLPNRVWYHYDVVVEPDMPNIRLARVIDQVQLKCAPDLFNPRGISDFRKNFFIQRDLGPIVSFDDVWESAARGRPPTKIVFKKVAAVNFQSLGSFLSGSANVDSQGITAITLLNLMVRAYPAASQVAATSRNSIFARNDVRDLPGGLQVYRGFSQSARPGMGSLHINVDTTVGIMYKPMALLEFCLNFLESEFRSRKDTASLDPSRSLDQAKHRALSKALKGLLIVPMHRNGGTRQYIVKGLHKSTPRSHKFQNNEAGREMTVAEYFRTKYNQDLRYPDTVCVQVGDGAWPLELCKIIPGQLLPKTKKLNPNQTKDVLQFATLKPNERIRKIEGSIRSGGVIDYSSDYLVNNGVQIEPRAAVTPARRLAPPPVQYGDRTMVPESGKWNMLGRKLIYPRSLKAWAIAIEHPPYIANTSTSGNNIAAKMGEIRKAVHQAVQDDPRLVICVLPHPAPELRTAIKRFGDFTVGVATQIVVGSKVKNKSPNQINQYCNNLALKINAKLGGVNCAPGKGAIPFIERAPTIIMGADVSHPAPGGGGPSTSALVSSLERQCSLYYAQARVQESRVEVIQDLKGMVKEALEGYKRYNTTNQQGRDVYPPPPQQVLFYRDGVSEGQFPAILQEEVTAVQEAFRECRIPSVKLTFIVVVFVQGKKHRFRMFPREGSGEHVDKSGNCNSGTVVDSMVTNPYWNDFYLLSHQGLLGTSRPAHYSVLYDNNNLSANELQEISFALCHLYSRATRAVSIPAVVYHADLVCNRWPFHFESDDDYASTDGREARPAEEYAHKFRQVHRHLRPISLMSGSATTGPSTSRRDIFEDTLSGAQDPPNIPLLQSDRQKRRFPAPKSLRDYRVLEGEWQREQRLRSIWLRLPKSKPSDVPKTPVADTNGQGSSRLADVSSLTKERAESLSEEYWEELVQRGSSDWKGFLAYVDQKEGEALALTSVVIELWSIFHEQLDLDGNGHVDALELNEALTKTGIRLTPAQLSDFMTFLTSSPHSHSISFPEFRDFLLLLPRKASTLEMYRYYTVRRSLGDDGHGVARVNMEGDVTLSAEDRHPLLSKAQTIPNYIPPFHVSEHDNYDGYDVDDGELEEDHLHETLFDMLGHSQAFKFLLAGGLAGAVSRTATAPFDRLKVFLITRSEVPLLAKDTSATSQSIRGITVLMKAISQIYTEAGILGFWVGNGLNVVKIFPESAIKFLSYESSKRFFAKHWDQVDDPSQISGASRFVSGGIGGIVSQFSIYPLETLKTQMMSSDGRVNNTMAVAMKRTWALGGLRAYYRGLAIGLLGVFPYSAIDMSTFDSLKLIYTRSTGIQEPGVLALLAFGSISGTVGATSVYPLNLVRTRLQASGSPGHPQQYKNLADVVRQTIERDGYRGFYRGLVPTLAKVIPAVSISYVVYENSKHWVCSYASTVLRLAINFAFNSPLTRSRSATAFISYIMYTSISRNKARMANDNTEANSAHTDDAPHTFVGTMFSTPDVQAAHAPGVMRIAFSASGKKIITAGEDGVVRVWKAHIAGEKEPKNVTELREGVNALAASNGVWASGGDDAMVKKFSDATDSMLSSITQTGGLPVRCLAFSPKGDRIAVGSDDLVVKVVDVEDTLQCALLTGYTEGLRALTWHPFGNLLTTTSQDGKILVWDCQQSPPKKVHELDGLVTHCLEPDLVEFSYTAAAVWHPNGAYFVTATPTHEIAVISKNGWTKTGTFSVDGHASEITSLAFSSNGNYLASTGKDNQIIIWDTESKRPVLRPSFSLGESESKKKVTGRNAALDALMADEDEEEGDDTAMDGDVVEAERDYDEDEQWVEDDIGEEYTKDKERFEEGTREMVSVTKAQPAFQPGSTPFKGRKCYFAFNSIGVIEVSDLEIHQVINVEFHDKSLRHDYHFQDTDVFTMAALGRWVPLLDTNTLARKAGKDEYYWPVSLSSKELLCVILKGGERYPGFPRPMIQEIEMQMPLLNLDAPQGQAEERFLRQSIHVTMQKDAADASTSSIAKQELELDKTLIQLIQLACKADKLQAALDLTRLLHHNASFESARKVAGFYHLIGLQERMGMLKDSKDLEEGDEEGFNPRKNWGKVMEPVGRGYQPNGASGSSSSKANFDDFGPPPAITRRTLARAVPVGEVAFARPPAPALTGRPSVPPPAPQFSEDSSMEIDPDITFGDSESLPTTSAKRKWDDGLAANGIGAGSGEGPSTKKRTAGSGTTMVTSGAAVPFAPPQGGPPKAGANANPFARKPGAEKPPNPFARGANGNKSIVKSNSFFEKVDAAEADAANGKRKGKAKESSSKGKQTTLFGLPAVSKDKDNKAGGKKARARDKDEDGAENVKANEGEPESQEQEESQGEMTDLTSTATDLLGDTQLEEGDTQLDDAQAVEAREPSPDWDLGEEEIEA
ncbi:hypothetical protein FRB99_002448 [Tulasnella sp. 403]|nr:hypothetical protein FRB99_002448 [Tulasnella sp. 403]